jgi:pimeloyl-ACP methyl ester carboxylesterase
MAANARSRMLKLAMQPQDSIEIDVSGVRSRVRCAGPQSEKEAVVFVHGNPGSSEDWVPFLSAVGSLARALAPDMPGYGKADRPAQFDYTVQGYARHLEGLMVRLGVGRAHLVLHDFGVPWGLRWATDHPNVVASVTLIDCGVMPGYKWHKYARIWRTPIVGELMALTTTHGLFKLLLNLENPRSRPFPSAFLDRMFDDLNWGTKRALLRLYRATPAEIVGSNSLAEKLRAMRLPALVIWGGADKALPAGYAGQQGSFFSPVEVHVFEGCGHWPFVDEPELFARLLVDFLRRQLRPQAH